MDLGAELADDDIAGFDHFTTEALGASALPLTVASVFRASARFFMCHDISPSRSRCLCMICSVSDVPQFIDRLCIDGIDFYGCIGLTMTLFAAIPFAALIFEHKDFFVFILFDDVPADARAIYHGLADSHRVAVCDQQYLIKGYWSANLAGQFFHPQDLAGLDSILFASRCNHRVHCWISPISMPVLKKCEILS